MTRRVLFCGGPSDGVVYDLPTDRMEMPRSTIIPRRRDEWLGKVGMADNFKTESVAYTVTNWVRVWHNGVFNLGYTRCATASIGEPELRPEVDVEAVVHQKPCPDFLEDFEGWWIWQCRFQGLTRFVLRADYDRIEFENCKREEGYRINIRYMGSFHNEKDFRSLLQNFRD